MKRERFVVLACVSLAIASLSLPAPGLAQSHASCAGLISISAA